MTWTYIISLLTVNKEEAMDSSVKRKKLQNMEHE